MTSKPQAWKIARTVAGLCVAAVLIYLLDSAKSPPIVGGLIVLAVVFFMTPNRSAGGYDKSPYFRRLAMASSRRPMRDLALAVGCFVAMMVVTIAIAVAVRKEVIPDNNVTVGFLIAVFIGGIIGILFFISGVISRVLNGPPPPP